jgi:Transposase DDE domain group 1
VSAVLRPGNAPAARGARGGLRRSIGCLKQRCPHVQMVGRGDSAFAVPRLLRRLEEAEREWDGIASVFGLAQHAGLFRQGAAALAEARARGGSRGSPVQYFDAFA